MALVAHHFKVVVLPKQMKNRSIIGSEAKDAFKFKISLTYCGKYCWVPEGLLELFCYDYTDWPCDFTPPYRPILC
jgi:hypothetical protein